MPLARAARSVDRRRKRQAEAQGHLDSVDNINSMPYSTPTGRRYQWERHMDGDLNTTFRGDMSNLKTRIDMQTIISAEHFAQEKEKIFRRSWMPLVHLSDLPKKGDYTVYEMPTFDTSLLVIRGNDDKVRCFHNA